MSYNELQWVISPCGGSNPITSTYQTFHELLMPPLLHLEVVLKERVLEVSMDLGNPDIVPSFRLQLLELEGTVG